MVFELLTVFMLCLALFNIKQACTGNEELLVNEKNMQLHIVFLSLATTIDIIMFVIEYVTINSIILFKVSIVYYICNLFVSFLIVYIMLQISGTKPGYMVLRNWKGETVNIGRPAVNESG